MPTVDDVEEMKRFLHREFMLSEVIFSNSKLITDGTGGWVHRSSTEALDKIFVIGIPQR